MSGARESVPYVEDEQAEPPPVQDTPAPSVSRRQIIFAVVFTIVAIGGLYFLVPKLAGLNQTWGRLKHGDPVFLVVAAVCELISVSGYAVLFRTVFSRGYPRLTWGASTQIPLAGIAAIRLLAAAGAGGIAVTVWALRRAGLGPRTIACRMVAMYVLQYAVYLGALVVCGLGLRYGLFSGGQPFPLTALPAFLAAAVIILVASAGLVPQDFERRLGQLAKRRGRVGRLAARFATAPAILGTAVRTVLRLLRDRRLGVLGAFVYWGFDIAVLGCTFRAFGTVLPVAILVMGYFLGTLGSLLPMPGGIGGVEGGMIGAFAAFGIPASHALVGTLAYSAIAFWLPAVPGIGGYVALRRRVRRWQDEDSQVRADQSQASSDGAARAPS
jgi:uncharacterized membrane protein YbhN (UPF0104 family)